MKTEKILLSFVAVVVGLIVAGVGFYFYQSTKVLPPGKLASVKVNPPTPTLPPVYLSIDSPQDESVTSNKTVTVSGKTVPDATIVVSTDTADQVITPSTTGTFSTTVTIGSGENEIHILSIGANGLETQKTITVSYTTDNF
ncbi:MAG TPA: hypothetical protein VFQ63_02985 [Patescibacteria group bacterium]|nr:hypothetical protein [Patescibacteria group bacterium]